MGLKPWYKVVTPREDLREGRPLDASEFAVHLDHVKEKRAGKDYQDPERFFERTFMTRSLEELAALVVRRMAGIKVETSAIYNLSTQFGGGKTHALTLLYHLAKGGADAQKWKGVPDVLRRADVQTVSSGEVAVFVGTEFDAITGRGGDDGTPRRHTPWGEIAFQLSGKEGFAVVAQHDEQRIAPSTEVIREFLPKDKPALILMDELLNFMGRNRKSGLTSQLYSFLQNLSEEARAQDRVVLAISLPSLLDEMTPEDESDFDRFQKLLDRLGKAMVMSAEAETSEIIRRRLFEWGGLPRDARSTARSYAEWVTSHRTQLPNWFPLDAAQEAFEATYPFHPTLISVFERKWQALPRFQQTRGILRLLALWISNAFMADHKGARQDPLICSGSAPLDDPLFRSAVFEQLGGAKLEAAVTTDIMGKKGAHALRLDKEAVATIRKARLHEKVATTIFFESNGGQTRTEATLPELRLAVATPDLDLGNVETVTEELAATCYFMMVDKNRYRFSLTPNLNKLLADRKASVQPKRVEDRVRAEVQEVFETKRKAEVMKAFGQGAEMEITYFPEKSQQIPNVPLLRLVVLPPEQGIGDSATMAFVDSATKDYGSSSRTYKSALIWVVPEGPTALREEARKVLAWEDISDERADLRLDETQLRQLKENLKRAQRDLSEAVWRSYKNIRLLGKDGSWKPVDLGLVHSSAAASLVTLILNRLRQDGDLETDISPNFLARNWPPALPEWNTQAVRDSFFASPQFPRLIKPEAVRRTIAKGVESGILAYVGKMIDGSYDPFSWKTYISTTDVEITKEMYIITGKDAEAYKAKPPEGEPPPQPEPPPDSDPRPPTGEHEPPPPDPEEPPVEPEPQTVPELKWTGQIPPQKWMNFYTRVLTKFATSSGLTLTLTVEAAPPEGVSKQKVEETKVALRELGLVDDIDVE